MCPTRSYQYWAVAEILIARRSNQASTSSLDFLLCFFVFVSGEVSQPTSIISGRVRNELTYRASTSKKPEANRKAQSYFCCCCWNKQKQSPPKQIVRQHTLPRALCSLVRVCCVVWTALAHANLVLTEPEGRHWPQKRPQLGPVRQPSRPFHSAASIYVPLSFLSFFLSLLLLRLRLRIIIFCIFHRSSNEFLNKKKNWFP